MKKKIGVHIALIILLAIPLFFLFYAWTNLNSQTDPEYRYETVTATEPRVYVTNYGECYHSSTCGYLHTSRIAKGKNQAISEGYVACSVCGGKSSGTITVTYKKRVPVDSTGRNIGGSIALAILCSPLLYGIGYHIVQEIRENKPLKSSSTNSTTAQKATQPSTALSGSSTRPPGDQIKSEAEKIRNAPIEKIRNFIGERVTHRKYGAGVVIDINRQYIKVRFDSTKEEKTFQFPEAFYNGFLTIEQ